MPQANPKVSPEISLGRNSSVLLDIIRFSAALAVLLSHLVQFSTRTGFAPEELGNQAVCVFFVLSGFVIRFVSESRLSSLSAYLIDRASRIYSVVLPALAFTVLAEGVGLLRFPSGYAVVAESGRWHHLLPQLLASVTFTDGFWGVGKTPLSNGALWSLTYEVAYYLMYGLLRYTRRARWVFVPLMLLIVGPSISALFLVWLLGALLFDVYISLSRRKNGIPVATVIFLVVMSLLLAFRHRILHLIQATGASTRVAFVTNYLASTRTGQRWFHGEPVLWLARLSVSFFFLGTALAALLLLLMLLLDRRFAEVSLRTERAIRFVADSTFTLYCFHLPILILIFSIVGHKSVSWPGTIAAIVATVAISVALARPLDGLKNRMRSGLRARFLPGRAAVRPAA